MSLRHEPTADVFPAYQTETDADGRFRIEIDSQAVHPGQTFMLAIFLSPEKRIVPLQRNEEQVKITIGNDFKPLEIGTVTVDDKGLNAEPKPR